MYSIMDPLDGKVAALGSLLEIASSLFKKAIEVLKLYWMLVMGL